MSPVILLVFAMLSLSLSAAFLGLSNLYFNHDRRTKRALLNEQKDDCVFLFEGQQLIDCSVAGQSMLDSIGMSDKSGSEIIDQLAIHYKGLKRAVDTVRSGRKSSLVLKNDEDQTEVGIEAWSKFIRLRFHANEIVASVNSFALAAMKRDSKFLDLVAKNAPMPTWFETANHQIHWANQEYFDVLKNTVETGNALSWPIQRVFSQRDLDENRKIKIDLKASGHSKWFEINSFATDGGRLFFAKDVTDVINANSMRLEFLQTLTKTFANLSTGLAVFDKDRKLILFNPALNDVVSLPIDFLASRPALTSVLDRMRNEGILSEPKDYPEWREKVERLEAGAADGHYAENWVLPDGRTLQVTGHPHPNGAVAFLFEDISSELKLTRQFQSEIALAYQVIDSFDDAVAVFTASGFLAYSNASYHDLFGTYDGEDLTDVSVQMTTRQWQLLMRPTPIWSEIRDFANSVSERSTWDSEITHKNGQRFMCEVSPLETGGLMVKFSRRTSAESQIPQEFFRSAS